MMKYEKPQIVSVESAVVAIQSELAKTIIPNGDLSTGFKSVSAYQSDE